MSWKFAKSLSITDRLVLIFVSSTILILSVITALIYPPMKELLHQATLKQEHYNFLLTQICIKKFFVGLWVSTLIIILTSYILAKKSMKPLKLFTKELADINASSLDKRLCNQGNPKEIQDLVVTCNEMLLRIELAFKHIKQFSASMAHELRNPIHYLRTTTEITLAKPQTIDTYQQMLQAHLEEYQHLTQLIDNLLFLTRCEHGQIQLNRRFVSASYLISSIIEYYLYLAEEKGVTLQVDGDAQILVDEHLFKRVISNLIDNSLAYMDGKGEIIIKVERITADQIQILIKDNGVGIAKEHLPLLCQEFYRVNYGKNKEKSSLGLGLGLAIANSIMEHHQGKMIIESQLGFGTSVRLLLNQ